MKANPFAVMPYRKQPVRRYNKCCQQQPLNHTIDGMVTLGSIAVIGGTTVGILNAFK